jgi:hypothetical protein
MADALLSLFRLIATLILGAALGLAGTYLAVQGGKGFGAVRAGVWTTGPLLGSEAADPYARAIVSHTGEIPLALAEGLMFIARTDETGEPLVATCTYRLSGAMPAARSWTLSLVDRGGYLVDNPAHRYGFTSQEIVRTADGGAQIVVSRSARAGNWLPIGKVAQFLLVLRLYDTPLSATGANVDKSTMLSIRRDGCG